MERLDEVKARQAKMFSRRLGSRLAGELVGKYKSAARRLFLLDYDGSLVSFKDNPGDLKPDRRLRSALRTLSSSGKNELVIISGRDRKTLAGWLGGRDKRPRGRARSLDKAQGVEEDRFRLRRVGRRR